MLDNDMLQRVAETGVTEAMRFFGISDEIEVRCEIDNSVPDVDGGAAVIYMQHEYLRAKIVFHSVNIDTYEEAWGFAGHEVAHLVTREIDAVLARCPSALMHLGCNGIENATTRLQRLFMRERPYPGDAQFGSDA
ncbi:hypothetical protein ACFP81_06450 [Deinococcus lacus]|uniref:IrrE N-terminal-like domain-containing protein n=1 Tax=Deinococcus lacus TaxID=392561 RepID=A0ABW1YBL6_9DEIO